MKIKYLTEDGVLAIRSNAENVYKNVIAGEKQSLEEFFQDDCIVNSLEISRLHLSDLLY